MIRAIVLRVVAYLAAAFDDSHCPCECPRHREAWLRRYPRTGW